MHIAHLLDNGQNWAASWLVRGEPCGSTKAFFWLYKGFKDAKDEGRQKCVAKGTKSEFHKLIAISVSLLMLGLHTVTPYCKLIGDTGGSDGWLPILLSLFQPQYMAVIFTAACHQSFVWRCCQRLSYVMSGNFLLSSTTLPRLHHYSPWIRLPCSHFSPQNGQVNTHALAFICWANDTLDKWWSGCDELHC